MRYVLAVCALLSLIVAAWMFYLVGNSRPDDVIGPMARFYAGCAAFAVMLLCGYGARALSYMADQSAALKRMAAAIEAMQKPARDDR